MGEHSEPMRIMINGKWVDVNNTTTIDITRLSEEFASQAALYAYFAVLYAAARKARDIAEQAYKQEEASAFISYKNDPEQVPDGGRGVSDALANMLVQQDEDCAELKQAHIEAEYDFRVLEGVVRALEQRANMLVSLGAQLRSEADMTGMVMPMENPGDVARRVLERKKRS